MSQIQTLDDVYRLLRRRLTLILSVGLIGAILSVYAALAQPKIYEAGAVIQIETPQVAAPDAIAGGGTATGVSPAHRVRLIEQRLMARDNLVDVVTRYDLFPGAGGMNERIALMRDAARITQIIDGAEAWRPGTAPSGLRITVRLGDPEKAAAVANDFLAAVMEQNRRRRVERAQDTLDFFAAEEDRVIEQIAALEDEIARFKEEHAEALPDNVPLLRDQIADLEETRLEIERQIIGLESGSNRARQTVIETQVRLLRDQEQLVADRLEELRLALADAPRVEQEFNARQRELRLLQERYSALTQRRAEAEMTQVIESRQQSERFEVLETAMVPEYSISPSRRKIAMAGALASLLAGVGLAFFLEMISAAIRTPAQLERATGLSPVISIPVVTTGVETRNRRLAWMAALAAAVLSLPLILRELQERWGHLRIFGTGTN